MKIKKKKRKKIINNLVIKNNESNINMYLLSITL